MVKFEYAAGTDTLVYDFENRLTRYVKGTKTPPSYDTLWFNYCGLGKRICKIETPHGQSPDTIGYGYDGIYAVCEFGGHLDLDAKYIYANGMLLARYDESPADTHYYHHDGLGSVMGMTDENKSIERSYFYDEFGNSLGNWGSATNHYLYTGQEYDGSVTGLYNLRARYYKPDIGRFISEDPMMRAQSGCCLLFATSSFDNLRLVLQYQPQNLNAYLYCANNPTNKKDIVGLTSWGFACDDVAQCFEEKCKKAAREWADVAWQYPDLLGDRVCKKMADEWRQRCYGLEATGSPPGKLPFNDECKCKYDFYWKGYHHRGGGGHYVE